MRKKGPIWGERYQKLIVESYKGGMFVCDILNLPEIEKLSPSEYTIRNILKANHVQANWRKKKRKPEFWSAGAADRIVALRNAGKSIRAIRDAVNSGTDGVGISKSTVVRILETHADEVQFHPSSKRDIWKPQIVRQIVRMYRNGMLINDICNSELLREFRPSGYVIRDILKSRGVKLTWKKGELRRWPREIQEEIVEMYSSGMRFSDILDHPRLKQYHPTNYAVRRILKKYGVKTKGETRYKLPISDERFRLYRGGRLSLKEESIVHKHLAADGGGRRQMLKRMRLGLAEEIPLGGKDSDRVRLLQRTARRWAGFFSWGMHNLSDEGVKKEIIKIGLEFGTALWSLKTALDRGDEEKKGRAWPRVEKTVAEMATLYSKVLKKPARSFAIRAIT